MEIPVLRYNRTVGTHVEFSSRERENRFKHMRSMVGKSAMQSKYVTRIENKVEKTDEEVPRKAAIVCNVPVP